MAARPPQHRKSQTGKRRKQGTRNRKKRQRIWLWRVLGLLLFGVILAGGAGWWKLAHWTPARADFPVQGFVAGASDGLTDFRAFRAIGADFAYLEATAGAQGRDAAFARNLAEARAAGIRFGVIHRFDPCVRAELQSANFVTLVPRDAALLPPAIELDATARDCPGRVLDASVESELVTFVNQIEAHIGKPVLLKLSAGFQQAYHTASLLERDLWVEGNVQQPDYAGRPWRLWTANRMLRCEAASGAVRWVVAQP